MELTLKVLSPEKTVLELADGITAPAGNSTFRAMASGGYRPGIAGRVEPHIEITWEPGRSGSRRRGSYAPLDKCKKRGRGRWLSEVGGTHRSDEAW